MSVMIENFSLKFPEDQDKKQALPVSVMNTAFAFYLTEVKHGDEVLVEFDQPKQMVPSLEQKKADSTLILQYSNAEPGKPATISVKLSLDINTGEFDVSGYGFTELTVSAEVEKLPGITETETQEIDRRLDLAQTNLEKKILEEWDKVKSDLKETTFEEFRDEYTASFWYDGANVDITKLELK